MIEYENVKDALKALYELNNATEITIRDMETGETRQAEVEDIQEGNREIVYRLADLLGITYDELEAQS